MDKIFQYLYYTVLIALLGFVVYLTTVLYLSPQRDVQERGFIPCTKELVYELSGCERGGLGCAGKHLWRDMKCNIGVIYTGAKQWLKGEQTTPWANYLFEPTLLLPDEEIQYTGNAVDDIADTEEQNRLIRQKLQELEAAKHRQLNIDDDVILSDPEIEAPKVKTKPQADESNMAAPAGDIADESAIDIEPAATSSEGNNAAPQEKNVLKEIKDKTDDKLQKGLKE